LENCGARYLPSESTEESRRNASAPQARCISTVSLSWLQGTGTGLFLPFLSSFARVCWMDRHLTSLLDPHVLSGPFFDKPAEELEYHWLQSRRQLGVQEAGCNPIVHVSWGTFTFAAFFVSFCCFSRLLDGRFDLHVSAELEYHWLQSRRHLGDHRRVPSKMQVPKGRMQLHCFAFLLWLQGICKFTGMCLISFVVRFCSRDLVAMLQLAVV
jgi:hypothetical protein